MLDKIKRNIGLMINTKDKSTTLVMVLKFNLQIEWIEEKYQVFSLEIS